MHCLIGKVQKIVILCTCPSAKMQNIPYISYFMHLSNCYILHLSIWASAEYSFYSHFLHLSNWESAEDCNILHLSIWASTNIAFIVIFCTCPIGKVQIIAIFCTCPFKQVQNLAFIVIFRTCPIEEVQKFLYYAPGHLRKYTYFCYWFLIL